MFKAIVKKHYDDAVFKPIAEHSEAININEVSFGPAYHGHDGSTCPPYAMVSFHIGEQETVDSGQMETARQALIEELQYVFGEASVSTMIFQKECSGMATISGTPETLERHMRKAMQESADLRYLLPRDAQPGYRTPG